MISCVPAVHFVEILSVLSFQCKMLPNSGSFDQPRAGGDSMPTNDGIRRVEQRWTHKNPRNSCISVILVGRFIETDNFLILSDSLIFICFWLSGFQS